METEIVVALPFFSCKAAPHPLFNSAFTWWVGERERERERVCESGVRGREVVYLGNFNIADSLKRVTTTTTTHIYFNFLFLGEEEVPRLRVAIHFFYYANASFYKKCEGKEKLFTQTFKTHKKFFTNKEISWKP